MFSSSTSTPPLPRPAIVARLRAAGCVFAEEEADLLISSAGTAAELEAMVDRRVEGLPLEQVVGWAWFCGIRVTVAPGVFVPRARTELLVRQASALAGPAGGRAGHEAIVVDLCCGSGAIAAAVAASVASGASVASAGVAGVAGGAPGAGSSGRISLYAADLDPVAVACARGNLEPIGARVYQGDLFEALPGSLRRRVDVLVANVPYVPTEEIALLPPEARLHEPALALDGGGDGLDVLRRMAAEALDWLAPDGHLLVETSRRQAPIAVAIMERAGLAPTVVRDEDLDATVVAGGPRGPARAPYAP
jgi:release factor glutamine methyltransferase